MNIEPGPDLAVLCPADVDLLVSGYCSAWNERDPERRLHRLRSIWRDDATFDNAAVRLRGVRGLDAHIAAFHAGSPGWRFVLDDVTAHGRHVHLTWTLLDAAGREQLAGHDVAECSADRRFARVVSFWRKAAVPGAGRATIGSPPVGNLMPPRLPR